MSIDFNIRESKNISGIYLLTPSVSKDTRGKIWTSFMKHEIESLLPNDMSFRHDKFSTSKHNVLRGIHGDSKSWKLITCVSGEIQQVVVDLRDNSPTYLKWESWIMSAEKPQSILIPPHMGNAYYVTSIEALYHYKLAYQGEYIDADEQFSVKWNDQNIGIKWLTDSPDLSDRDR